MLLVEPPEVVQLTVAAEFPLTLPRSGSVAAKVIVAGLALTEATEVAAGKSLFAAGTMSLGFCWPDAIWNVQANMTQAPIDFGKLIMLR